MTWIGKLRTLPLRAKVAITFVGVVALLLAASTFVSFRYWQREFLAASQQQAALAAASTRAAIESTLASGRPDAARRSLSRVVSGAPVSAARIYGPGGDVLLSADLAEEGTNPGRLWIPSASDLPREGVLKETSLGDTVRAYLPLSLADDDALLEIELPVASMKAALERGALLGNGLMLVSFVALGVIIVIMLQREVMTPLERMEHALGTDGVTRERNELGRLEASVNRLLEREREATERAARRDQELAAQEGLAEVGELAAEMAHEFKRPLVSIRTAIDLLQQEYHLEEGGQEVLGQVNHQLERLSETMRDLFALAKPVALERSRVQVEEVVTHALMEARSLPGAEAIEFRRDYADDVPTVEGDPHRLEQAFQNLAANAVEAMPDGGLLTVRVTPHDGEVVEVAFIDTGPGIDPDEIDQAVRPFYSTKARGTGLGLPLVARIAHAHRGRLQLHSAPGEGTTARILLPVTHPGSPEPEDTEWLLSGSSSSTTTT